MTTRGSHSLERRQLLGVLASSVAIGLAGCSDSADDDGTGDDGNGEHSFADGVLEHPGDEPLEFSSDQSCPVCGMTPTDYPNWSSQLAHENGEGAVFDAPGCLFAYYADSPVDSPVEGAWITDYETGDLIDATEADIVPITDEDEADDPMGIEPRVFADEDDAHAFIEEWDAEDLSEDDIIALEDVDREVAMQYRPGRLS